MKKNILIGVAAVLISIKICNYMYDNSSKQQMIVVLSTLIASTAYMAIQEICNKIDQCRKK